MQKDFIETINTGILVVDEQKTIIKCNTALGRMSGMRRTQVIGRNITDVLNTRTADVKVQETLRKIDQLISKNQDYIPKGELIPWNDKVFKIDLETFMQEGKMRLAITLTDYTWYESELARLGVQNTKLIAQLGKSTSSDRWIRKMILGSLFASIAFCLLLTVAIEVFSGESTQYLQTLVTSFTGLLSVAIGFYFRADSSSKKDKLDESVNAVNDTHLPEEKIINIE